MEKSEFSMTWGIFDGKLYKSNCCTPQNISFWFSGVTKGPKLPKTVQIGQKLPLNLLWAGFCGWLRLLMLGTLGALRIDLLKCIFDMFRCHQSSKTQSKFKGDFMPILSVFDLWWHLKIPKMDPLKCIFSVFRCHQRFKTDKNYQNWPKIAFKFTLSWFLWLT